MTDIIDQVKNKEDIEIIIQEVMDDPKLVKILINTIQNEKSIIKFGCEKVLRLISERNPRLIYPHFDFFVSLLDVDNSFLKWGAILTIANLTSEDAEDKFLEVFDRYFSFITGSQMVSANNVIGSSVKIANNKPELISRIVDEILRVDKATYIHKGEISPECKNIAYGEAINTFDKIFAKIEGKKAVMDFVKRQTNNSREKVSKAAQKFMKKHS